MFQIKKAFHYLCKMKRFFVIVIISLMVAGSVLFFLKHRAKKKTNYDPFTKLEEYQRIIKRKNLNIQYVFVIDYSLHSGLKRFYIVDIMEHKIVKRIMVAHGAKSETERGFATEFSNVPESNKSSLGYVIVKGRGVSKYGIKVNYVLDGISKTNSNMRKRFMVMHSYFTVPFIETHPIPIINSLGCVMLSNRDMTYIDSLIQKQHNKRILMYIRA